METLKYKVIKSRKQYDDYCRTLEELVLTENGATDIDEEIELLTLLIEKFDQENNSFASVDPITVLKSLMTEHKLKAKDLIDVLGVSKGLISDILNYKKGLSKEVIRKLSAYFSMNQEAFNRPYELKILINPKLKSAHLTKKQVEPA